MEIVCKHCKGWQAAAHLSLVPVVCQQHWNHRQCKSGRAFGLLQGKLACCHWLSEIFWLQSQRLYEYTRLTYEPSNLTGMNSFCIEQENSVLQHYLLTAR
jgi:hypothetical protein